MTGAGSAGRPSVGRPETGEGRAAAGAPDAGRRRRARPAPRWAEPVALVAILVLAALARLPGLAARGQWDSDQGHDMSVLAAMVGHGAIPLLGPPTSVGTFHHGALYYYLLAPAAALSGADPVAVTVEIALLGIAAVAATWWLARLLGGPLAAATAALLLALSPAGISESTFIWNPNPIPLFAALAAVGVVTARRTGRIRWWALAAAGTAAVMQLHWLGGVTILPVGAAWLLEVRRRRRSGGDLRPLARAGLAGAAIVGLGYLPLAVHELTHDFGETRAVIAYMAVGGGGQASLPVRLLMVALRSATWPVAGLLTDRVAASLAALAIVLALGGAGVLLAGRAGRDRDGAAGVTGRGPGGPLPAGDARWAARWMAGALAVSAVALAFMAPSLAVIVPELPNDHYHAFLDPLVLALVGTGVAGLWGAARTATGPLRAVGRAVPPALVAGLAAIAVTGWPPAVSPDGGWPLADAAAGRVVALVDAGWPPQEARVLVSLPAFKPDDALRFPLERRGFALEPPLAGPADADGLGPSVLTFVCDPLFDEAVGFACGGPAEDRWLADAYPPATMQLVERFRAGPRRIVSVYGPSRLAGAARRAGG